MLFRGRQRLVRQRTELVNALRADLYEFGHIVPEGIHHVRRMAEILEAPNCDLPDPVREECLEMLAQIAEQTARIDARTEKIQTLAAQADVARWLQTIRMSAPSRR